MTKEDIVRLEEKMNAIKETLDDIKALYYEYGAERRLCEQRFNRIETNAAVQKTKTGFIVAFVSVIMSAATATIFRMLK